MSFRLPYGNELGKKKECVVSWNSEYFTISLLLKVTVKYNRACENRNKETELTEHKTLISLKSFISISDDYIENGLFCGERCSNSP